MSTDYDAIIIGSVAGGLTASVACCPYDVLAEKGPT